MQRTLSAFIAGLLFGVGLAVSQMTNPLKVLGFLDVAGDWDASLMLVLGGAVTVTFIAFRFVLRRTEPIFDSQFHLPKLSTVDKKNSSAARPCSVLVGVSLATALARVWRHSQR